MTYPAVCFCDCVQFWPVYLLTTTSVSLPPVPRFAGRRPVPRGRRARPDHGPRLVAAGRTRRAARVGLQPDDHVHLQRAGGGAHAAHQRHRAQDQVVLGDPRPARPDVSSDEGGEGMRGAGRAA